MLKITLFIIFLFAILGDSKLIKNSQIKPVLNECETCFDLAFSILESLFEVVTEGGVFAGCVDLCQQANGGYTCIFVCTVIGEALFVELVKKLDLDPIYYCQLLSVCPIGDCTGNCVNITNVKVNPNYAIEPATFDFTVNFKSLQNWTGTGMAYYQVSNGDFDTGQMMANGGTLLEFPLSPNNMLTWSAFCDENWDTSDYNFFCFDL